MKNIFKILICSLLMVSFSCQDSENTIDTVLDYETGAVLRTISVENAVLNASDPSSAFVVTVEEQDEQDGALLESVNVYVALRDLTTDYTTPATGDNLAMSIPASEFTTGPVGLPRTTVNLTFGDAAAALGLSLDEQNGYNPGDVFIVKLEVVLSDGRVFGASSASGIITGGFFSSPFQYNALLTCSPMPGTYVVDMYDNYGDGWQTGNYAHGISIDMDGVVTEVAMCSQWGTYEFPCVATADGYYAQATVEVPVGTGTANWSFEGDQYGEIAFVVTAPDGSIAFSGPSGQNPPTADDYGTTAGGLLPIAVCAQ
jgi:hypothetical protein